MKHGIISIANNGITDPKNPLQLKPINEVLWLSVDFDSIESRDLFAEHFPKSLGLYVGFITSISYPDINNSGIHIKTPHISLRIKSTKKWDGSENKITGLENESGNKKMYRFYTAVATTINRA